MFIYGYYGYSTKMVIYVYNSGYIGDNGIV